MNNEAITHVDKFLIENWHDASSLVAAVSDLRSHYDLIVRDIFTEAKNRWPELEEAYLYLNSSDDGGAVGVGVKGWPRRDRWASGLYIGNLSLDNLLGQIPARPWATIWIATGIPNSEACKALRASLCELLPEECRQSVGGLDKKNDLLWWDFPPDNDLSGALRRGDLQVVQTMVLKHVAAFVQLIPSIVRFLKDNAILK
jgi:hypothetical protein